MLFRSPNDDRLFPGRMDTQIGEGLNIDREWAVERIRARSAAAVSNGFQRKISIFRNFRCLKSKVVVCNRRCCSAQVWTVMCVTHCRALFFTCQSLYIYYYSTYTHTSSLYAMYNVLLPHNFHNFDPAFWMMPPLLISSIINW